MTLIPTSFSFLDFFLHFFVSEILIQIHKLEEESNEFCLMKDEAKLIDVYLKRLFI
jgi:hypothetical protein